MVNISALFTSIGGIIKRCVKSRHGGVTYYNRFKTKIREETPP